MLSGPTTVTTWDHRKLDVEYIREEGRTACALEARDTLSAHDLEQPIGEKALPCQCVALQLMPHIGHSFPLPPPDTHLTSRGSNTINASHMKYASNVKIGERGREGGGGGNG